MSDRDCLWLHLSSPVPESAHEAWVHLHAGVYDCNCVDAPCAVAVQVSFQWKNPGFLFKNPDLLSGIPISY